MNENEIARIAAATNQLRPDWPIPSLISLITDRLGQRPRRDVAVALAWVACDSRTLTPARVAEAGPWWKAATVEEPDALIRRPPKAYEQCPNHVGQHRDNCGGCAADRKAAREEQHAADETHRLTSQAEAIAAARAAIKASRAAHLTAEEATSE